MGDTDQMALEVETLAQRLEFCSGSELLSTLEELESMAASRPDLATVSLPALFKLVNDPSAAGAEATQQAVEVVSRLVSPKVDSSPELAERARLANGEAVVSVPGHVVVLIDLLESDVCETYTVVVVLELLTSLSATRGEELRRAVLAAPAGSARLLETLSDRRDEVRNAGLQLWEHLTRPSAGEFDDLANGLSTGDELRTNFAFNDGFAKVFAAIEEDDGRVAREAARLAANVLAGPPVAATMLQQHNVEPFARLLSRLPRRYADEEEDEETQESEEPDEPRLKSTTVKRHALVADALADAAAGLVALWRLVANDRGGVSSRSQAQATIWKSSSLRSALLSIALESDLDPEKVLFEVADSDNTLVDSPEWWVAFAMNDDRRRGLGASRRAVRAAALEVLRLCLVENEAHALDMCEATFVSRPARVVHALHATLELATFDDSKAGLAACSLAETTWAPEGAAIVVVMHAVAPPPPIDDDSEVLKPALEVVVAAIDADGPIAVRALGLLRRLLARSPSVRELALKIPALKSTSTNDDADEDDAVFLLGAVIRRLFRAETVEKDDSVVTHALAVVCAWLRDNGAAAHALLRDPDHADGVAAIARGSKQNKRAKGLASLALGLCLEHFGDEERAGWTKATVSALVERRVGLGAFARGLDALREDAAKSSGRRRYEIAPDDVFAEDKAFADFASQAADDARRRAIGGLVEEPVATEDAPTDGNKESLDDLVAQRDFLEEQVQQQAEEISRGSRQREQMRLQEESLKARVVELQAQIEGVDGAQQTVEVGGDQQQQIDSLRQQALSTIAAVSTLLKLDVVDDSGNVETRLKMLEQALPGALSQGMEPADQMLLRQAKEAEAEIRKENSDLILRLAQHAQLVDELTAEKSTAAERLRETEALVAELEAKKDAANSEMELRLKEALEQAARRDEEMRTSQADGDAIRDLEEKVREANERAEAAEIEADKVVDEIAAMQDRVFQAERRANLAGDFDVDALELLQLERVQLKEQIKQQSEQLAAATSADNGTSQAELLEKEQTIRELQKALDEEREARSLIDEERSMRAQEAEQAEAAKDAMEQEVDKQTAELAALKNRMSELERDDSIEALAPSSAEVETLRQTVEQQREHLDVFEAESARLKQQLLEAEERLFAAQEMTRLAAESAPADDMERVRGELDEAHSRVGELEALLDTSESSRREFEEEQNSLREALEAEILQHRETADDAQSKLDSVQASLAARAHEDSQEREELRAEVKRLQAELEGTCSSMEELRTQLASSTDRELDEVASLKNELDAQRLLAEQSQVARDVLQGQVEQQSGELVALQSDLATAELKLDAAESARAEAVAAHRDIVEQQSAQASIDSGRQQETVREAEALAEEKRAALQREATALESLSAAEAKIEALQSEASAQLNPRIEADKHLVMLQEMLDDSEKETTRLASELASARLEVATLSATLGDAEAEAEARAYAAEASFATRALEADARLAASEEKMARFEASREQSIAALEAELRSASSDLDAAKREILSLTERSAAMSEELELKEASLSEHFEARNKARIAELEGELKEALAAVEKESAGLVEETSAAREALEKRCAELESEVTAMIEDADSAEVDHERELASLRAAVEAENASRLDELSRKHDRELEEFEAEHTRELKRSRDELLPALESARAENDELTRQLAKQVDLLERQLEAQAESRLEIESRISQVDLKCVAAEERAFAAEAALESQRRLVALEQTAASCVADALSSAALESFSEVAEATRGVEREDETDLAASLDAAHLLAAREREEFEEKIRIAIEERDVAIAKAEDDIRIVEARVAEVDLGAVVAEERACAAETALLESKEKVHNLEACLAATAPVEATPPFDYEQIVSAAEERASTAEAALLESREKVESLESSLSAALNATQQEDHFEIDAAEERAFTAETALEESQEELQSLETSMTEAVAKAEERTRAAEAALHESREKVRSLESSLEEVLQKQKASPREDTNGWEDHDDIFVGDDEQGGEDDEQQSSWRSRCIAAEWRASSLEDELRTAEAARGEEIESLEAALEDAEATAQAELESRLQAEHILEERKATVEELRTRLEEAEQRARALAEDRRDRRALGTMTELASAEDPGLPENVRPLEPVVEQNEAVVEVEEEVEAVEDDVVDSMHDRYREMLRTGLARDTIVDIMMRRGAVGSPAEAEAILASFDAVDDEAMFDDDELFEAVGTETDDEGELTLDAAALADEGEREVRVIELENELDQTKQELAEASDRVARLEQESTARSQQLQAELEETKQLLHDAELREQQVEEEAEAKLEESEAAWEEQRDDLVAAEDRLAASESEAAKLRARCDELERVLADRESTKPTEAVVDNDALFSAQSRAAQLDRELSDAKRKAEALEAALREAARPVDDVQSPPVPAPAPPREHGMTRQELERLAGEVAAETRLREELERRLTPNGRRAPRTPSRNGSQHTSPNRMGEDDEHWLTARAEESLRDLEDEHNDLLALLAQQELEKEVLASYVRDCVGAPTLLELKHKTQSECVEKYGVYVDYEDYNEGDNIENIIRAGEEHDLQPLTLPFDIPGETDTPENQQHLAKGQMHPPMPPPTVVATS